MNSFGDPTTEGVDLAGAIETGLREAVGSRERSDDRLVRLAEHARTIATDHTDRAFAAALRSTLEALDARWELKCDVMVAAEQLAHVAGASRFSVKTHALLAELRSEPPGLDGIRRDRESHRASAAFRGVVLALARTIGLSVTADDLMREETLRNHEPMLWLELAAACFGAQAYVESVRELLEKDRFHPFALVRVLPVMVRHQGTCTAQEVLDVAYRHLAVRGMNEDASELIRRAEAFDPRGWRSAPKWL